MRQSPDTPYKEHAPSSLSVDGEYLVATHEGVEYRFKLPQEDRQWSVTEQLHALVKEKGSVSMVLAEFFSDIPNAGAKIYSHTPDAAETLGKDYRGNHALWMEDLYLYLKEMSGEGGGGEMQKEKGSTVNLDLTGGPIEK